MSGMLSMSEMPSRLSTGGVVLACQREGVRPDGTRVVEDSGDVPSRVVHIFDGGVDFSTTLAAAWCGLPFVPGVLENLPRDSGGPHKGCLRYSAITEESLKGVARIGAIVGKREGDWRSDGKGRWTFTGSFNGFFEKTMRPRGFDMGIEHLQVRSSGSSRVHIRTCGIRGGCSQHQSRTEIFPFTDRFAFESLLTSFEAHALSFDLESLAWCLLAGECAGSPALPVAPPNTVSPRRTRHG
jgi:hypothetical protein